MKKSELFTFRRLTLFLILIMLTASCSSIKTVSVEGFSPSTIPTDSLIQTLPNYENELVAAKGKGRAIVSEPGNSNRVTIEFETDTSLSLLTIRNRIGIEGGVILVDADSILIYSKVDKIAQKVSASDGRLTSLNELASINLINLLNFKISENDVDSVLESKEMYRLNFSNLGYALINKSDGNLYKIYQPQYTGLPYSEITYESYSEIEGYKLPRKITILSADGNSKVLFQVRSLEINPDNLNLSITIPDDIPVQRL